MYKTSVSKYFIITSVFLAFFPLSMQFTQAESKEAINIGTLMKKAEKVHTLTKEKEAEGLDVSNALKFDQESKEAAGKGDLALASELLDDAIMSLTATSSGEKTVTENKEPVTKEILVEKAKKLRSLIEESAVKGINISNILKLDQESRIAAEKGDFALAGKLLDDAIKSLTESPDKKIPAVTSTEPVERLVELPINAERVTVTEGVPKYERGEAVIEYKSAFHTKTVIVKDGIVKLEVNSNPLFVEENKIEPPVKVQLEDSPFGFHPANTYSGPVDRNVDRLVPPSKMGYIYNHALDIGVRWNRPEFYALWNIIQKTDADIRKGVFNWKENDYVYGSVPKDIGIVGNIGGIEMRTVRGKDPSPRTFTFKSKELEEKYIFFVQKLVERYDGDGIDDMPGLKNPVKYWQVDNEPDLGTQDWEGYAHLMEITYKAIKSACPECKVIMGGLAQGDRGLDKFFTPILKKLHGQYVDVFDFHLYGQEGAWRLYKLVDRIKASLLKNEFKNTEIWLLETGTYSGKPEIGISENLPEQTEKQQASDLIKRYVFALSLGIKKIFWAFGIVEGFTGGGNHEFDRMGLMYYKKDTKYPKRSYENKKLAYYSYQLMTKKLEGSDFSEIKSLNLGEGIYAYKFNKFGKSIYVLWAE